ncbi:MAG: hypothetical protein A2888_00495 [Chlamydiae bacterium RIFCSPLOWO2_01_FULL_28_7]|nr:MAG: hypothetical protein A2888_00495 [Chlamydiae bacterium RIFCSPLOWO2_01_FULL_28_7]
MSKITKDMTIYEIFENFPEHQDKISEILLEQGLGCIGCSGSQFESLEEGLLSHGIDENTIEKIIVNLNSAI